MNPTVRQRSFLHTVAQFLIAVLIVQLSPIAVLATESGSSEPSAVSAEAEALDHAREMVEADLEVLRTQGKEAYLDDLFQRLDREKETLKQFIMDAIERFGAKRFAMMIMGLGSPVLMAVIAAVPAPWVKAGIEGALKRFVTKALRTVKGALARLQPKTLEKGLAKILALLGNQQFRAGMAIKASDTAGSPWFEKFFGNSTVVQNFLICIIAIGSTAVAAGLAIAGSTAAPVVAVVGALVALVGLIKKGAKEDALEPRPAE